MEDKVIIINDFEGFKEIKKKIDEQRRIMYENITDSEKTKEVAQTLNKLYIELGTLCANCHTESLAWDGYEKAFQDCKCKGLTDGKFSL